MKSFNVAKLAMQDRSDVVLIDPIEGTSTNSVISIAGPNTETCREAMQALKTRRQALLRRYKDQDKVPIEDVQEVYRLYLADLTLGWKGITDGEGDDEKELPFSRPAALKLYENPIVVEQVTNALNDARSFIKG